MTRWAHLRSEEKKRRELDLQHSESSQAHASQQKRLRENGQVGRRKIKIVFLIGGSSQQDEMLLRSGKTGTEWWHLDLVTRDPVNCNLRDMVETTGVGWERMGSEEADAASQAHP